MGGGYNFVALAMCVISNLSANYVDWAMKHRDRCVKQTDARRLKSIMKVLRLPVTS